METQTTDALTRRRVWISATALLVLAGLVSACVDMSSSAVLSDEQPTGGGNGAVVIGERTTFQIEGDATTVLTPGSEAPLDLKLINSSSSDLAIVKLTVEIQAIDAPLADNLHPCSFADFEVRQLRPTTVVSMLPANSERTLKSLGLPPTAWPHIVMLNRPVDQDGCQQGTLALTYTGVGTVMNP